LLRNFGRIKEVLVFPPRGIYCSPGKTADQIKATQGNEPEGYRLQHWLYQLLPTEVIPLIISSTGKTEVCLLVTMPYCSSLQEYVFWSPVCSVLM
jgi:hypothetical protein